MFPWNYGFHWAAGNIIFLGAFYTVVAVVAGTLLLAMLRARRALAARRLEAIEWDGEFHDLTRGERVCRHVLTGELRKRECRNGFDCRTCPLHAELTGGTSDETSNGVLPHPGEEDIFGMAYPLDRLYHRGHTWVHPEPDGTVTIGLDELGQRLVGRPDEVEMHEAGSHVRVNGTAFRVRRRDAEVRVLSPVDGEVVETGGPDRGWYLKVKPMGARFDLRNLLCGCEVRPWLMREMERLQLALAAEGAVPTLADGGVPVADIAACYPDADWDAVCGEMFLRG
jgi:hypothetical protein